MNPYEAPDAHSEPESDPAERVPLLKSDRILAGVLLYVLCSLLSLGTLIIPGVFFLFWFTIGLSQLLFVIPLFLYLRRRHQLRAINGVLIMTGIIFLLNGGCYALVFAKMSGSSFH